MNTLAESRSAFLKNVRIFFDDKGYIEVDVPALSPYADIDPYIDPIEVKDRGFLHTSPEYALKELLSQIKRDIYFLGHVYRKEEVGKWHNEEFTMIEWYKTNTNEEIFIDEVVSLIKLFLGPLPLERIDYEIALARYDKPLDRETAGWSNDEIRHYKWGLFVEPNLGRDSLVVIENFLPEDASLAKLALVDGTMRAKRFEFYHKGIELANGFLELSDPQEQTRRFNKANEKRKTSGKETFSINPHLIEALERGLPENTYGMAAGFDRLFMLHRKEKSLHNVLAKSRNLTF